MNAPDRVLEDSFAIDLAPPVADQAISYLCSPGQLRAAAFLYGIETVPLEQARVLELGCGAGSNLMPFAAAYPQAQVVGVDPDARRIEAGRRAAASIGLDNLTLHALAFAEITQEFGEFDYIIAHDVFSTLDRDGASDLLRICRLNLAFEGVGHISFDAYPGAKATEIVREAVLMHAQSAGSPEEQVAAARAALGMFTDGVSVANPLAGALHEAATRFAQALDEQGAVGLSMLGRQPYYYAEFADMAAQFGMICVGDVEPRHEMASNYGTNVSLTQSLLGFGKPPVLRQQYLDFSVGRAYRRALLTHHERGQEALPRPDMTRLVKLRWAGSFRRIAAGLRDPKQAHFVTHAGQTLSTDDRVQEAVADVLGHAWPASVSGAALVQYVTEKKLATTMPAEEAVGKSLQSLFDNDTGRYSVDKTPYDQAGAVRLVPGVLAAVEGNAPLFNLWHETVAAPFASDDIPALRRLADGAAAQDLRERVQIEAVPMMFSSAGDFLAPAQQDNPDVFKAAVDGLLDHLKHFGLIVSDAQSWCAYVEDALRGSDGRGPYWSLYIDALARRNFEQRRAGGLPTAARAQSVSKSVLKEAHDLATQLNARRDGDFEARARDLVKRAPDYGSAWEVLGTVLRETGKADESLGAFLGALKAGGEDADCYVSTAMSLRALRRPVELDAACRRALELVPDHPQALNVLANCYRSAARFHEAVATFRHILELNPDSIEACGNLGVALADMGDFAGAEEQYLRVLAVQPDSPTVQNAYFFGMNYFPDRTPEEIFEVYRSYDERLCAPHRGFWKPHGNMRNPDRKLRIGYVSPDFRNHPVRLFLAPLMAQHDKSAFEVYAYAQLDQEDEGTAQFKDYADHWLRTNGLSHDALAQRIRDDQIDVLVDLAGHTSQNRLATFARRPAPVQVTWLGFGCTTGLSAIDYILMDDEMAPPGTDHLFVEKPWRLDKTNFAYRPKAGMGEVSDLPALSNGHVRFVTLSRAIRFNYRVVRTWAEILRRVPDSRLVVDSNSYFSERMRSDLLQAFGQHGIAPDRLEIGFHSPPWDVLRGADITLDCFPHNSGTTLFESLYMGLPYVTLAGPLGVGRIGASTLSGLGRREWIAQTEAEYVEKVVAMASDIPELARIRAGLRQEMQASALMDETGFARKVEQAYRDMFKKWCEGSV
ncbi:bifunctional class I SAM-dependent methyltransferase/glycosyltransferase [Achromobacter sp. K91]|uniref:bifunctional class I SAM-dependent methyltransferase/glycosyltransferase n=1 Tax=Achromobacter sp. K91 TaxID=2292262 RepID=UPI0013142EEB|nr:bifunctional class I SAM-dependent methyltransferase/glycosyltransferase [Achromobacter sp. K91]